ncbi:sensor histidine kinase [Uliginosibacterium gangwonense]|uniref:sensor histidine kinase n=1 Tax=Uliginosibacterium gangwonense TaxID=392736 RepID=UPI0003A3F3E7|nr:sensor histidine kinase [Uliginosibacterium gangwonense]
MSTSAAAGTLETGGPASREEAHGAPGSYTHLTLYVFGAFFLLSTLIAMGVSTLIQQDRLRQRHMQDTQLASLTRVLQEYVSRTLDESTQSLKMLRIAAETLNGQAQERQRKGLQELATHSVAQHPEIAVLAIYDRGQNHPIIARRAEFTVQELPSQPSALEIPGGQPFQVQRPMQDARGKRLLPVYQFWSGAGHNESWEGAIALIDLDYIESFYQDVRLSSDDRVHLLDNQGGCLISFPLQGGRLDIMQPITNRSLHPHPDLPGIYQASFDFEGKTHIGNFSRMQNFPLIVGTSRAQAVMDAEFLEMRRRLIWAASALLVVLGVIALLIHFDMRRRERSRQTLGEVNTSLEERVQQRTAELEQSNRELMAFSYSVSHDLRAPLRAINGFAHALKEDNEEQLDTQGREYLDRIYRASVRMGELIDELLSLANVSRAPLKYQALDLADIAREIVDDLRMAHPERQVEFQAPEHLPTEGDEALLRNALSNLLHNAWKFTHTRTPAMISLSVQEDNEVIRYTLEDNGIGFDMAHAKRLFQPFQQLHAHQGFGGTGIGLASVRRIIERHNGSIRAEAQPDAGARFIFELPRHARVLRRRIRTGATRSEYR